MITYLYLGLYGLFAGVIAKALIPGDDEGGIFSTIILGILGSISGGYLYNYLGYEIQKGISLSGLTPAVTGAVMLLLLYKLVLFVKRDK